MTLGWGCMFIGKGHDRLVSRRWLEHGPWLLHRFPGDVSLVQFHDLDADSETALAQAQPGHHRMGISDEGGFIQTDYVYSEDVKGIYVDEDQTLRIVCAPRRTISQAEMLDACAVRYYRRDDADPVRQICFIFIEPEDAKRHLHEMWLRELEVWTFTEDGKEIRIDTDYHPQPDPPSWVRGVKARET